MELSGAGQPVAAGYFQDLKESTAVANGRVSMHKVREVPRLHQATGMSLRARRPRSSGRAGPVPSAFPLIRINPSMAVFLNHHRISEMH